MNVSFYRVPDGFRMGSESPESALHVGDAATANGYYADAEKGRKAPHCCRSAKTKTLGHNMVVRNGRFYRFPLPYPISIT